MQGNINIYEIYADVCVSAQAQAETRHFGKQVSNWTFLPQFIYDDHLAQCITHSLTMLELSQLFAHVQFFEDELFCLLSFIDSIFQTPLQQA